ncbi:MAG: hypothetical protein M3Z24_11445, partial [Chloroflexota bacterium]|nr:hypothetical protein [Chloroflexota bacterium]
MSRYVGFVAAAFLTPRGRAQQWSRWTCSRGDARATESHKSLDERHECRNYGVETSHWTSVMMNVAQLIEGGTVRRGRFIA